MSATSYNDFADNIMRARYSHIKPDGTKETWAEIAHRVATNVMSVVPASKDTVREIERAIAERKFIPGGRFLAQAGRPYHQTSNCIMFRAVDTREGWGELIQKCTVSLMSGAGVGVDYSDLRPEGSPLSRSGGTASGMIPLLKVVNEVGRGVRAGGARRSAIYGSLRWSHDDVLKFIHVKDWPDYIVRQKNIDYDTPAPCDMTNISVILDRDFFEAYHNPTHALHAKSVTVYWEVIHNMLRTGEPGFQIDYDNPKESLRNACSEVVSEDDSDVCVLGSVNFGAIESLEELKWAVELGQIFLLAGTEYTDRPIEKIKAVQEKNRRTGLGGLGFHEWLIKRGKVYGPDAQLGEWLTTWRDVSVETARKTAAEWGWNTPKATRAIAPNGTIAIAGGRTTGGIEPIFSVAYKRQYLTADGWRYQYVVDPVAERLIREGADPTMIEDAYSLSDSPERRVAFQRFVQSYTDNAISSTVNLRAFGSHGNDDPVPFGKMLLEHLPHLRGITVYPDGARGAGQPIQAVDYSYAVKHRGVVYEQKEDTCKDGVCGL